MALLKFLTEQVSAGKLEKKRDAAGGSPIFFPVQIMFTE